MRIISGEFKGRRILPPKNLPVRPTKDIAKEALFNILNNQYYFDEVSVLDLYSGTGSISYEFASRGSDNIVAIDNHFNCIKFIEETSKQFNFNIRAIKSDAIKFLEKTDMKFNIVFSDPPYGLDRAEFYKIPDIVFSRNMLQEDGLLILEHSKQMDFCDSPNFKNSKNYGGSVFSFFKSNIEGSTEEGEEEE